MLNNGVLDFTTNSSNVLGSNLVPGQVVRNTKTGNAMIVIGGTAGEQLGTAVREPGARRPGRTDVFGWSTDPDGSFHTYPIYTERQYEIINTINTIKG